MITLNSTSSVQKLLLKLRVSSYDIGKCLRCNQSMVSLVWQAMVSTRLAYLILRRLFIRLGAKSSDFIGVVRPCTP